MISIRKTKTLILIVLGTFFVFSPITTTNCNFKNSDFGDCINSDHENLKISKLSAPIWIDDTNPSMNWSVAKEAGLCTGSGNYTHPYVIEDLVIDEVPGIMISNSDVFFRIENCTVYGTSYGIRLENVNNGQLIDNNCSSNYYSGIYLDDCINNTVSGNTANYNEFGISLGSSNNNTILGNIVNNNIYGGISLGESDNNTILGNTANYNEYGIFLSHYSSYNNVSGNTVYYNDRGIFGNTLSYNNYGIVIFVAMMEGYHNNVSGNIMNECGILTDAFQYIDTTNLVNGKPVYYYTDEVDLGPNNFTNAGQVIMLSCTNSLISNLNTSYSSIGIYLRSCYNCTITGNIANFNKIRGISITYGAYNNISGNSANYNVNDGIYLNTEYSDISGNTANYNGDNGMYSVLSIRNTISGNTANYNDNGMYFNYGYYNDITGNTANNNSGSGIGLGSSNNNTISGNTANNNTYGIYLTSSDYNTISGNTLIGNVKCIREENCQGNEFSDNGSCTYGEGDGEQPIPGYNLFILFGILSIVAILITKKV
ncbi:MAG: nitrous oxide reductase family maturation protein NosD, partial [Candidatus Hodarchaeota archaeon]